MRRSRKDLKQSSRRATAAKRSGSEWALRGVLVLGALVLGYTSIAHTLANVIVKAEPAGALALAPGDGRIMAALAEQEFAMALDSAPDSEPARLAREALRLDATAVEALNVLGFQAQLRNEETPAAEVFSYSVALSRRELRPQIWAIEEAVARGDIEEALNNYDVALRTSQQARATLFPILAAAISESKIREYLIEILGTRPNWAPPFIIHAATSGPDPQAVAQLFHLGTLKGLPIEEGAKAHVVRGLVARNLIDEAWAYYGTFRPGVERSYSRDPDFDLEAETRAPFDWNTGTAPGLSVAILRERNGGFLDFALPSATRATVASQVQLLPPGSYRLEGRSRGIDQPQRSQPYWSLTCQGGKELGRVEVPNSEHANGRFSGHFTVPAACPVQTLSLVARASDEIAGVSGVIERVRLAPEAER